MYWNRFRDIECLPTQNDDFKLVVNYLDEQYRLGLGDALKEPQAGQGTEQSSGRARSPIRHIKKRPLTFYKNDSLNRPNNNHGGLSPNNLVPAPVGQPPVLFEVDLDLSAIDEKFGDRNLTNYEWTRVYVVRVREDKTDDNSKHSTDNYEWYVLDGESGVLHALNAKFGGVNIDTPSDASDYLDFFCSFLSAEEGVFALIRKKTDVDGLEDEGGGLVDRDLFERRHYSVRAEYKKYEPVPWEQIKKEILPKLDVIESANRDAQPGIASNEESTQRFLKMSAVTLYGRHIFESEFKITEAGMVEMAKDTPLHTHLAVRHHSVITHKRSGLILYTKSGATKEIPGAVFMEYVRDAESIAYCSNIVIGGKVEFDPAKALTGLECSNVQFLHDVVFDHCEVASIVRFEYCRFLGGVSAAGTRFCSQVAIEGCEIFALQEARGSKGAKSREMTSKASRVRSGAERGRYAIALNLEHARVEGSLSLEWLTVHGSVSGRHLTVQSDANFTGLQVIPLVDDPQSKHYKAAPGNGPVLLDLQRSSFVGSLNLGISVEKDVGLKGGKVLRRTRVTVCGDCRFDTMSVGKSLILEGLAVVKSDGKKVDLEKFRYGDSARTLSMSNVMVKGNIQSWEYDSSDATGATINPPLLIDGPIDLRWSKVDGYVDLRGSHVTGDLDCTEMRAAWLTLEHSRLFDIDLSDEIRRKADEISWAQYSILDSASRISPVGTAPEKWIDQFAERMSVVQGDLKLGNAIIPGGVNLRGASIGRTVAVYLSAELGLINALPCFGIYTEFTETTDESGAKRQVPIKGTVVKQSASLGRLSIRDSTIAGPVNLWGAHIGGAVSQRENVASEPAIDISTSSIKGGLYLHARSSWEGQDVLRKFLNPYDQEGPKYDWVDHLGKDMEDQSIREMAKSYFWQTAPDVFHTTIYGNVDILATDIGADLDLSNSNVRGGRIRLNDSYVKCDVRVTTCLQELDPKITAPPGSKQGEALRTELQTQCSRFEFQALRCDGDLMLAGLAVDGDVDGRNAVVRGHAEFNCDWIVKNPAFPLKSPKQDAEKGRASIRGNLELCGCEIGLLRIDGQSFEGKNKTEIDLSRATLSTLKLLAPLPKRMNLQSIKVDHWDIGSGKKETELLELLEATKGHYDSWPYKSIENSLTAQGEDDAAKAVFVSKNWAEWHVQEGNIREEIAEKSRQIWGWPIIVCILFLVASMATSVWPWSQFILLGATASLIWFLSPLIPLIGSWLWHRSVKEWIWGKFMGFGTALGGAVLVWALLSLGLAFVLSDPHNAQPTFAAVNSGLGKIKLGTDNVQEVGSELQKARNELQKQFPQGREWGFRNALWLALDITVPLVPFNLHDEWEPRESTEGTVMPCCLHGELLMAPKTFANISTLLSWIIWSLIATALASVMWARK